MANEVPLLFDERALLTVRNALWFMQQQAAVVDALILAQLKALEAANPAVAPESAKVPE